MAGSVSDFDFGTEFRKVKPRAIWGLVSLLPSLSIPLMAAISIKNPTGSPKTPPRLKAKLRADMDFWESSVSESVVESVEPGKFKELLDSTCV